MKEHNFIEEWPPFGESILALLSFRECEIQDHISNRSKSLMTGKRIIFWEVEKCGVVWKDSFSKIQLYDVQIEKWWYLSDLDQK